MNTFSCTQFISFLFSLNIQYGKKENKAVVAIDIYVLYMFPLFLLYTQNI